MIKKFIIKDFMLEVYKVLCNTKLILHITIWTIIDNYKIEFTYKKKDEWI